MLYNLNGEIRKHEKLLGLHMSNNDIVKKYPISVVRFGMGKEIQLYTDELVVTGQDEDQETRVQLDVIKRLILVPGDPTPSKLVLMADLYDDTTIILAEGMSNARDYRTMPRFTTRSSGHGRTTAAGTEQSSRMGADLLWRNSLSLSLVVCTLLYCGVSWRTSLIFLLSRRIPQIR